MPKKNSLLETVKKNLSQLQLSEKDSILLAVSGGSDSMVMLHSVLSIFCKMNSEEVATHVADGDKSFCFNKQSIKIAVATVNHEIRSHEESSGDADFVCDYCKSRAIQYFRKDLQRGEVETLAKLRKTGIEDAARVLRYAFLESLVKNEGFTYVFLAHNKNDQEETLLMRFLQGSSAMYGIEQYRKPFFRPLLNISKNDILSYSKTFSVPYKVDASNANTNYLRNNIRHNLVPVLDSVYPGWKTAILSGAEKARLDAEALSSLCDVKNFWKWQFKLQDSSFDEDNFSADSSFAFGMVCGDYRRFVSLPQAIQVKCLYEACNLLEKNTRVSFSMIKNFVDDFCKGKVLRGNGFCFESCKDKIFLSREENLQCPTLEVNFKNLYHKNMLLKEELEIKKWFGLFTGEVLVSFPVENSSISFSNGVTRLLKDLFSSEGIPCSLRRRIPILTGKCGNRILTIVVGGVFGFRNWQSLPQNLIEELL